MAKQQEVESIRQLARILTHEGSQAKLVGANGEEIYIPESICQVLRQVVNAMASGKAISIVPEEQEMTTQQAADFLNVSRPYLIKLLEQGEIPYIKVGSHRRVRLEDLKKYKQQRSQKRSQFLKQLVELSEEAGLYEDE
ncbi:helix-turn-helix domain-containing protein [Chlorogloeopsis sp. ULAP01]|uniref:helix-turn-helix domain-containing protein n=1 Tax=Chlorogloeopsis sp. ULAP01 TaxID=3056483 RepID=UPI0025AAE446|nr:helix-turn-helix domain-containing protein [Chlorogloeopsis sp. ULAP01]MDM9384167.1 helix-turn-helix domain-containing protein [Chlorogloeopsis sp. ULAP01]